LDHRAFTRALSERFGIQARGGCACAGPYVHRLMQIEDAQSEAIRAEIRSGDESHKPGFVRLNLSVLMEDETIEFILGAVAELVADAA
jgi:selenocysteine lyase/cysteine desulfurase